MADTTVETLPFQGADASKITITRNGSEAPAATTPPATEPKEAPAAPPATPPAETTPPADTPPTPTGESQTPPADGNPSPATPEEYTEEQFHQDVNTFIGESTGGAVKGVQDITRLIEENRTLKAQLQHKEPDFPSPAAKQVYELAVLASGAEVSTARQLFHVMSLDLSKMTPKEKQFEAFHLDRPNLTREEALKRFEAAYETSYSDLENNLVQLDAHEMATSNAETKLKEKMSKLQETVKQSGQSQAEQGPTPEQLRETETQLQAALAEFGGVSLKFDDSQYGKLDIPMDQGKAQQFMDILREPYKLIDQIADSCRDQAGKLDLNAFVREMYLLFDRDRISQEERDHLMKLGKITQIQEQKNTPKKDLKEEITTPVKKSFQETMAGAIKAAGMGA